MKNYIGKKEIRAEEMNRRDYITLRGWELPEDENGDDPGYLVEYVNGGGPNVEGYSGYVSWSPKEVFEKSYKLSGTFLDRLDIEINELKERSVKLETFIKSKPKDVDEKNMTLLVLQYSTQNTLLNVLNARKELLK